MQSEWLKAASIPPLPEAGLHLWRYRIEGANQAHAMLAAEWMLNPGERSRAERLRLASARREFVAARALLRLLLGSAIGLEAQRIAFAEGPNGKPYLRGSNAVEFNVAHSGGLILIALSRIGPVGVDVELLEAAREGADLLQIARDTLTEAEVERIEQAKSSSSRMREFHRAWTRKEAVAKADGRGIAMSMSYAVSTENEQGECRVSVANEGVGERVEYFVQTPDVGAHHLAAIATLRERQSLTLLDAEDLLGA